MIEKETPPPQKLSATICKIAQIFVASLLMVVVINEWPQFICLYRKVWIVVFIVNELILIYFTWFVYTFDKYKYNVLLKRDDMCLMPLSTFVTLSRFNDRNEIRIVRDKIA